LAGSATVPTLDFGTALIRHEAEAI
jgi:hypothetical protein